MGVTSRERPREGDACRKRSSVWAVDLEREPREGEREHELGPPDGGPRRDPDGDQAHHHDDREQRAGRERPTVPTKELAAYEQEKCGDHQPEAERAAQRVWTAPGQILPSHPAEERTCRRRKHSQHQVRHGAIVAAVASRRRLVGPPPDGTQRIEAGGML